MNVRPVIVIEIAFLSLALLLANIRSLIFWGLYPPTDTITGAAWREIMLWIITLFMMGYLLRKRNLLEAYLQAWRNQPLMIYLVAFSLASIFWSTDWTVTLHRGLAFVFATMTAVYLGTRYSLRSYLNILAVFGAATMALGCALILVIPALGTDLSHPYNGAWRGIFWHKNQLGNILPLFIPAFLFPLFSLPTKKDVFAKLFNALSYCLLLTMVIFAESASGYILTLLTHFALALAFAWIKLRERLRPPHYFVSVVVILAGLALIPLNLESVLSIFNRSTSLTGRIPLWEILLRDVFPQNLWLGHGFGTIWANLDLRLDMRDKLGWLYPVLLGDNGFLDLLLNLGVIGFAVFLSVYSSAWFRSGRYFLRERSLESSFPLIFMIYTFFANITFSLFMEIEVFVWGIMVVILVMTTRRKPSVSEDIHRGGYAI